MLVEFRVSNFCSIFREQQFSFVRTNDESLLSNTFHVNGTGKLQLLNSAVLYGANASGKSNFLSALKCMRNIVVQSSQRGVTLPVVPFKLNSESVNEPSEFEASFVINEVRYQYGFSATKKQIFDEWLYAFPKGRAQKWFVRHWDQGKGTYVYNFGSNLLGKKLIWQTSTRNNALFLSTAVQLNSEQLKPIFDWFKHTLHFAGIGYSPEFSARYCINGMKDKVLELLKAADLHIDGLEVKFEPILPDDFPVELKKLLNGEKAKINTFHKNNLGEKIIFDFEEESAGTQRFFSLSGPVFDALSEGKILIVDELNSRLHPELVKFLVNLFHNKKINTKNSQLFFTTHETSILNSDVFRRDQVWFCEKDSAEQSTMIFPLSNFIPVDDNENLEFSYLTGRYGAIPFIRNF